MRKKIGFVIISILLVWCLAGCGQSFSNGEKYLLEGAHGTHQWGESMEQAEKIGYRSKIYGYDVSSGYGTDLGNNGLSEIYYSLIMEMNDADKAYKKITENLKKEMGNPQNEEKDFVRFEENGTVINIQLHRMKFEGSTGNWAITIEMIHSNN